MKNKTKPTGSNVSVLFQICNLIPGHLVSKLARECGAEQKARTFTCWSHVFALLYAQITHAIGLNDVCDAWWVGRSGGVYQLSAGYHDRARLPEWTNLLHGGWKRAKPLEHPVHSAGNIY